MLLWGFVMAIAGETAVVDGDQGELASWFLCWEANLKVGGGTG